MGRRWGRLQARPGVEAGSLDNIRDDPRSIHFPFELNWIIGFTKGPHADVSSSPTASPARLSRYQTQIFAQWLNADRSMYQPSRTPVGSFHKPR